MSTSNHTPPQVSVTNQPQAGVDLGSLDLKQPLSAIPFHEKSLEASLDYHEQSHHCQHDSPSSEHHKCHNIRLRQIFLPAMIVLLAIGGLLAWSCVNGHGWSSWGVDSFVRRAVNDTATSHNNGGTFVRNKLYLIVLFVGLLVVLVLGIMLTAWCCKGSFNNPLCCPCYLCACCGGLACLQCISCGLCAEGISEM